jgi:hypothetical protein
VNWVRSDCQDTYKIEAAYKDHLKPLKLKQGDMNCYCKQQFDKYGTTAIKTTFEDGEQYCKDWYLLYGL